MCRWMDGLGVLRCVREHKLMFEIKIIKYNSEMHIKRQRTQTKPMNREKKEKRKRRRRRSEKRKHTNACTVYVRRLCAGGNGIV